MEPDCPLPRTDHSTVQLAHGGGGRLMQQLLQRVFLPAFGNPLLDGQHDGAVIGFGGGRLAFTTDSYVVHPLFFPGGDIGTLAVNGSVNDLAMCGARPQWLSAGFIIEEGLSMETLGRIVASMRDAAAEAGVEFVTGDTKVVDKGKGDGLFINTAGLGVVEASREIAPRRVMPGDAVLISGDVGRHGMSIMSVREGLEFASAIESDCAPLSAPVLALLEAGIEVHCLRDLTRGGLSSALNEIAVSARLQIDIEECAVPVCGAVRGACELLGLDPLYVANEGCMVVFVAESEQAQALEILRGFPPCRDAEMIGSVRDGNAGMVTLKNPLGVERVLDLLSGEQLPRIC